MPSLKVNQITNAAGTGAPDFEDGIKYAGSATSSLNTYQYTESATAPSSPNNGALWWDTTNSVVKIYANNAWQTVTLESFDDSTIVASQGDRGVFTGGALLSNQSVVNTMDYISISTTGNATDFGDMDLGLTRFTGGASNKTRGVVMGGVYYPPSNTRVNNIQYFTFASSGGAQDFGDLLYSADGQCASSNATYGLSWGGLTGPGGSQNVIQYITIATTGDATDFGDMSQSLRYATALDGESRNIKAQGSLQSGTSDVIEYVNPTTPGNATDFGDMISPHYRVGSGSDLTRGVISTGNNGFEYITMATPGNATDFGDIGNTGTMSGQYNTGVSYNGRVVFAGGSNITTVMYITIQTLGNSLDFGDLSQDRHTFGGCSGNAA